MTAHPPKNHLHRRRHQPAIALGVGALGLFAALGIGVSVSGQESPPTTTVETGEINAMGLPVVATPGERTGIASAGPVEVTGASWQLGTVPLDVAVRPAWTLRNAGSETVVIGEPHPEVREGCCPGTFSIDSTTIQPGDTADLGFELSMHAGMDGWHDIAVHVPIRVGDTDHILELDVSGDFRSA